MHHEGFCYWLAYKKNNTCYYRCRRYKNGCGGRVVIDDPKRSELGVPRSIRSTSSHNHTPEPDRALVDKFRKVLTLRAQKERAELYTIYWEEATTRHTDAALLYSFTQAESAMRKARRKLLPSTCTTIRELNETLHCSSLFFITCGALKENMFKGAITSEESIALLFLHSKTAEKLGSIEEIHVDHSIKSEPIPPNFNFSILTIHAVQQKDSSFPFVYVVITVKSQSLFSSIFMHLKNNYEIGPKFILSCYDSDLFQSLKEVYPDSIVRYSYFSFSSNLINKMKLLKIPKQKPVMSAIKMLLVLPLLPASYIRQGLQCIKKWSIEKQAMNPQLQYLCDFCSQWILRHGAERISIFSLPHCVTDHVRNFNEELQTALGVSNPTIWQILESITHIARATFTRLIKKSKQVQSASMHKNPKKGQLIQDTIINSVTQTWVRSPVHLRSPLQFLQVASGCVTDALLSGVEELSTTSTLSSSTVQSHSLTYTVQAMNNTYVPEMIPSSPITLPASRPAVSIHTSSEQKFSSIVDTVQRSSSPPPLVYYRHAFLRKNIELSNPPALVYFKKVDNL